MDEIVVGLVRRAHGLGGELHVAPWTDDPEEVFVPGRVFRVAQGGAAGRVDRLTLESRRPHRGGWLLRFREVSDRSTAERYAGCHLALLREELRPLETDEFFVQELVGFEVLTSDGAPVGAVDSVYEAAGQTLLGVGIDGRERLVPFSRLVVTNVDGQERKIWIDPPAGLLDL